LTEQEEAQLLAACSPLLREIIAVGVDTGLRRSNLVHLQRSWVQQHGTVLIVPRQHLKARKVTVLIPLTTRTAAIIRRHALSSAGDYVFTQSTGKPYTLGDIPLSAASCRRDARSRKWRPWPAIGTSR
jgi:integrase